VLRVASTSRCGWVVYGRASANAATSGWLSPTAIGVARHAQPAAASARSSPVRARHTPASSSAANSTTP
jgi:hypothetical protein